MESALARGAMVASTGKRRAMSQTAKFEETLRRLAMIDEGFVEDEAGLGIDPPRHRPWIPRPRRSCRWGVGGDRVAGGRAGNQTATDGPPACPAVAGEKGMATCCQRADNWTVVLRRQPARIVERRPEGGYTDMFELICCDCGDDPDLDYREVSPRLQLVRGPYPIAIGIAAYEQHVKLHQQPDGAAGRAGEPCRQSGSPATWPPGTQARWRKLPGRGSIGDDSCAA
jgi:hypothetical protein